MALPKIWTGRLFTIGFRPSDVPAFKAPKVGMTLAIDGGPHDGRKVVVEWTPGQARAYAAALQAAADEVDHAIEHSAIARIAAEFEAEHRVGAETN